MTAGWEAYRAAAESGQRLAAIGRQAQAAGRGLVELQRRMLHQAEALRRLQEMTGRVRTWPR